MSGTLPGVPGAPSLCGGGTDGGAVPEETHWPAVSEARWDPGGATDHAGL